MFEWMNRRAAATVPRLQLQLSSASDLRADAGEYRLLYRYLRDRFADSVVLTFDQIEDLIGFPLPESARQREEWWACAGVTPSAQSDSWVLANRSAVVHLSAKIVVFDRCHAS